MEGRNHCSDSRCISRLHYATSRQDCLGSVNHSSDALSHENSMFVYDGKFPRMHQKVGEDTRKDKQGKEDSFLRVRIQRSTTEHFQEAFSF
jgi:hypothetical protein